MSCPQALALLGTLAQGASASLMLAPDGAAAPGPLPLPDSSGAEGGFVEADQAVYRSPGWTIDSASVVPVPGASASGWQPPPPQPQQQPLLLAGLPAAPPAGPNLVMKQTQQQWQPQQWRPPPPPPRTQQPQPPAVAVALRGAPPAAAPRGPSGGDVGSSQEAEALADAADKRIQELELQLALARQAKDAAQAMAGSMPPPQGASPVALRPAAAAPGLPGAPVRTAAGAVGTRPGRLVTGPRARPSRAVGVVMRNATARTRRRGAAAGAKGGSSGQAALVALRQEVRQREELRSRARLIIRSSRFQGQPTHWTAYMGLMCGIGGGFLVVAFLMKYRIFVS